MDALVLRWAWAIGVCFGDGRALYGSFVQNITEISAVLNKLDTLVEFTPFRPRSMGDQTSPQANVVHLIISASKGRARLTLLAMLIRHIGLR